MMRYMIWLFFFLLKCVDFIGWIKKAVNYYDIKRAESIEKRNKELVKRATEIFQKQQNTSPITKNELINDLKDGKL